MRVITGSARGHRLVAPSGRDTRPTSDRVKEALFSSLQAHVPGARVMDLYAGSGALGIEALSRGATSCTFVESNRAALSAIDVNLAATRLADHARVQALDAAVALGLAAGAGERFDLVLVDPPYRVDPNEMARVLAGIAAVVAPGGLVRVELATRRVELVDLPTGLQRTGLRTYGDTAILELAAADGGAGRAGPEDRSETDPG